MTTKEKLLAHVAALPDDVQAVALIYADADKKIAAYAFDTALPTVIEMLGIATVNIGRRMVPAMSPAPPAE